jgi:hypothetical protein
MTPTLSANDPAKERAKESPKRINESSQRDHSKGDPFDSACSCSENPLSKRGSGPRSQQRPPTLKGTAGTCASEQVPLPLFCTLFERFVQARLQQGKWNYFWQQMEEDIATDDRLVVWWAQHQVPLATKTPDLSQKPSVSDSSEDQRAPEESPPALVGWTRREAAHAWGEQLLVALIAGGYEAEVRVHLEGQWYQLVLAGDGGEWVLDTPQRVQEVMEQLSSEGAHERYKNCIFLE